jgi:hypothetical protein
MMMFCTMGVANPKLIARFEHVYALLDAQTARAVSESDYLRNFCGLEQRTITSDEGHYRGMYLFGRDSYVELFAPGNTSLDKKDGGFDHLVGIGLNTERLGRLEQLKPAIEHNGLEIGIRTYHKNLGGQNVDWVRQLAAVADDNATPGPNVQIFVAEYVPSYMDNPEADKAPSLGPDDVVSVARYLRRGNYRNRLLKNISAAHVAITREDWPRMRAILAGAGFRISESRSDARAVGDVPLSFQFVEPKHIGLQRVNFILNSRPGSRHVELIGRSRLVVGPEAEAVWTFYPAPAAQH